MQPKGVVACGHPETAAAAEVMLREGGNAFDAALAALCTACVVEPVLASLGGGGFMLAHTGNGAGRIYDFFAQTPATPPTPDELDFYPIHADFGSTVQEFHIGRGAAAVPGVVKGLFEIHQDLGTLPIRTIIEPARLQARDGAAVNPFQSFILEIVGPIYRADAEVRRLFRSESQRDRLKAAGEVLRQPQLADTLDALAHEGEALFYRGEIAREIAALCTNGGLISMGDLEQYQVARRHPLRVSYRGVSVLTNPPPSSGGTLIAVALGLLEALDPAGNAPGSPGHLELLRRVQAITNQARLEAHLDTPDHHELGRLLDPALLERYRSEVLGRGRANRGTTHISTMDTRGNIASLTVSNGEGCGRLIPGTGIMLNNMLGEEDLNPGGFHRWLPNQRMTSMMAPSLLLHPDGDRIALGSGGSNRIRTAMFQVISNLIDFGMSPEAAIGQPRIHEEGGSLNLEGPCSPEVQAWAKEVSPDSRCWDELNLFFGGVHLAGRRKGGLCGAGDPRRGGVSLIVG